MNKSEQQIELERVEKARTEEIRNSIPAYSSDEEVLQLLANFNENILSMFSMLCSNQLVDFYVNNKSNYSDIYVTMTSLREILMRNRSTRAALDLFIESHKALEQNIMTQLDGQPLTYPFFGTLMFPNESNEYTLKLSQMMKTLLPFAQVLQAVSLPNTTLISACNYMIDTLCNRFLHNGYPSEFLNLIRTELRHYIIPHVVKVTDLIIINAQNFKPLMVTISTHVREHPEDKDSMLKSFVSTMFPMESQMFQAAMSVSNVVQNPQLSTDNAENMEGSMTTSQDSNIEQNFPPELNNMLQNFPPEVRQRMIQQANQMLQNVQPQ